MSNLILYAYIFCGIVVFMFWSLLIVFICYVVSLRPTWFKNHFHGCTMIDYTGAITVGLTNRL